jgi:aspartate/methionine/tyrosine aminotransferase
MEDLFSKRSAFAINPIREEDTAAEEMKKRGIDVIKLNTGDPAAYMPTPDYITDAYINALKQKKTSYSRAEGVPELLEAVSKRYKRIYNADFDAKSVITTQGLSEALGIINSALINDSDYAFIFRPYYPAYMTNIRLAGGDAIFGRYYEDKNWGTDVDDVKRALKEAAGKKIKYMMITNPNNPTGTILSASVLKELVDIANEHDLLLISDEIYDEIVFNGAKFTSLCQIAKGMPYIVMNGVSKNFDATGFRVGFIIVPEEDYVSKALKQKFSDYARIRLSVNTPAEYACVEALNNVKQHDIEIKNMVSAIQERINYASSMLDENPCLSYVKPNGAFYIFPKIDLSRLAIKDDREFVRSLLQEEHVQLTRGSGFGEPSHIRIVSLPPKEILGEAVRRINRFCKNHSK